MVSFGRPSVILDVGVKLRHLLSRFSQKPPILLACVSTGVGIWFVGLNQIEPSNTRWLRPTPGRLDHAVAQLNWEFLRWAPNFQWPLTSLSNLGTGWNTVYVPFSSGSLFGIFLKYLDPILPREFQFLGIWLIFSFAMLGYSAGKLMGQIASDCSLQIVSGLLFIASPVVYYRVGVLGHFELSAHWLLLLSFYFVLNQDTKLRHWNLLIIISLAVNIYLAAMVVVIFLGDMIYGIGQFRSRINRLHKLLIGILTCAISMWVFGYFVYSGNSQGLGFFRLNGASLLYSQYSLAGVIEGSYSRFFGGLGVYDQRPFIGFEREGFAYLGLGMILGCVVVSLVVLRHSPKVPSAQRRGYVVIFSCAFILLLNAFSPRLAFGRRELIAIPVPREMYEFRQIFRTAERFVWPFYYFIFLLVVLVIARSIVSKRTQILLIVGILLVQVWDISGGVLVSRNVLRSNSDVPLLEVSIWDQLVDGKDSVTFFPVFDFIDDEQSLEIESWRNETKFFSILEYAADRRLTTNFSVTGRPVTEIVRDENLRVEAALESGKLDASTLYILPRIERWTSLKNKLRDQARFVSLDGFFIIEPLLEEQRQSNP